MRARLPQPRASRFAALAFALAACAGGAAPRAPAVAAACEGDTAGGARPGLPDALRRDACELRQVGARGPRAASSCGATAPCETAGGLGLLWYDDEPFDSPLTLKVEWMIPGDANSGVFVGFPAVGNDPFVAVERGYEIQIDPTDNPASTTGAIYSFQAADQARRDQALRPPGEWNTYEITVDAPRIVVRLNGVVINRFVSTSAARQSLGHGFVGLQNHSDADHVFFRSVQVKEWGGERPRCAGATRRAPSDAFSGARLDGCRWNRIVRYDGGGLDVSGGALHLELTAATEPPPPTSCSSVRRPARGRSRRPCASRSARARSRRACSSIATTATTSSSSRRRRPAARCGSSWSARPGTRAREAPGGECVAAAERHLQAAPDQVGLALHGLLEPGRPSWRRLGSVVNGRLAAGASYGLVALGPGRQGAAALRSVRALSRPAVERAGGAASRRPRL